jgi:chemotaxis protein histidine kinase CheA
MKKLLGIVVLGFILIGPTFAAENKNLTKKETIKFLDKYAITIEDERSDGVVTYIFYDSNYKRFKDFKVISEDAWRFSKLGALRLFNKDIKITWKIKLGKKNIIRIKAKYDPIGKVYEFSYQLKEEYIESLNKHEEEKLVKEKKAEEEKKRLEQKKIETQKKSEEEKRLLEQEKIEAQKKAEEEILETQKKAEEEKRLLEQEKIEAQKKAEEEILETQKKAEKKILETEKKAKEEKLEAQKKAAEEKKLLEEEKLVLQKEIEEQRKKHEEEKKRLEQEKLEAQKKAAEEKLEVQRKLEEEVKFNKLEPKYRFNCQKRIYNKLFKIGSEEYRTCILNKGPEKKNNMN